MNSKSLSSKSLKIAFRTDSFAFPVPACATCVAGMLGAGGILGCMGCHHFMWVNFITTSLFSLTGNHGFCRETINYPQIALNSGYQ